MIMTLLCPCNWPNNFFLLALLRLVPSPTSTKGIYIITHFLEAIWPNESIAVGM